MGLSAAMKLIEEDDDMFKDTGHFELCEVQSQPGDEY